MNICNNCKHCKRKLRAEYWNDYECKLHRHVDYITGKFMYDKCKDFNLEGECKQFEISLFARIKKVFGL